MFAEPYTRGQARIVEFVAGRDLEIVVPATPDWTALDVLRHLTGVSADISKQRFEGFGSDDWTAEQVLFRSLMAFEDIVAEWDNVIGPAAQILDGIDQLGLPALIPAASGMVRVTDVPALAIGDMLHHEFDLRQAYGDTEERDRLDVQFSAAGHVKSLRRRFTDHDLATLRVEASDSGMAWDIGYAEPVATIRGTSFDLMRAIGGRRTRDEIAGMEWTGDAEPFLDYLVLPHLHMRDTSLNE